MMFWIFSGIVIGAVITYLVIKVKEGKLTVKWYQWVLGILGTSMLLFTIQNYFALINEYHNRAASYTWSVFGLPALVMFALIWVIPFVAGKVSKKTPKASA
ncbi:MAG: dehalogenase [Bacillota bacterium]|nr:dehalogenase [Bacillota bacterium]